MNAILVPPPVRLFLGSEMNISGVAGFYGALNAAPGAIAACAVATREVPSQN